jgi:flavin reductase (DIM6/NTAB) family NADH-FMN oxidoreductase RutF
MESIEKLVAAFERGEIEGSDFPHERHVRVARGLARRYPRDEALRRLEAGIRGIAERAGRPGAYHETITRAWFELVAEAESLEAHPELFDRALLDRYYSRAQLAAGREGWLEPDLSPLRLQATGPPEPLIEITAVFRHIPAAVAVLATHDGRVPHATTVSSFTSVSRKPALVSVSIANGSRTLAGLRSARAFTISILAAGQEEIAGRFAERSRPAGTGQFAGVAHRLSDEGPLLDTAAAWLGCDLHSLHPCGDHHIAVGRVVAAETTERRPLVRHEGAFHS